MRRLTFTVLALLAACGDPLAKVPVGDSPVRGPADAWVTMVEFADYQCPFCAKAAPTVAQLEQLYPDDLRLVFKHFPLSFHERALPAAHAAECARAQSKFWEMHDRLFASPQALADTDLLNDASQIGLNTDVWIPCLTTPEMQQRVDADSALGTQAGVSGTPTFFVNGRVLVGNLPIDDFKAVIDDEIKKARSSGIPVADYYRKAVLGEK